MQQISHWLIGARLQGCTIAQYAYWLCNRPPCIKKSVLFFFSSWATNLRKSMSALACIMLQQFKDASLSNRNYKWCHPRIDYIILGVTYRSLHTKNRSDLRPNPLYALLIFLSLWHRVWLTGALHVPPLRGHWVGENKRMKPQTYNPHFPQNRRVSSVVKWKVILREKTGWHVAERER